MLHTELHRIAARGMVKSHDRSVLAVVFLVLFAMQTQDAHLLSLVSTVPSFDFLEMPWMDRATLGNIDQLSQYIASWSHLLQLMQNVTCVKNCQNVPSFPFQSFAGILPILPNPLGSSGMLRSRRLCEQAPARGLRQ